MTCSRACVGVCLILPVLSLLAPARASAQAWVPERQEGAVAITFQRVEAQGHFLEDGAEWKGFQTRASNLLFDVSYGLTRRLALSVAFPFVNVKYTGADTPLNLPDNRLDDGRYHGTLQDLRFELRYNAFRRPFAATPFVVVSIPSRDYPTIGEAAAGAGLKALVTGVYAGRLLNPLLSRGYVHGSYAYAFVERAHGISLNRSNVDLEIGYFVLPSVPVSFLWRRQWTHGGLDFAELFEAPPEVFRNMDRVTRQNAQHLGIGAGFPVDDTLAAHANVLWFVSGQNAHMGWAFSGGLSWTFSEGRIGTPTTDRRASWLARGPAWRP